MILISNHIQHNIIYISNCLKNNQNNLHLYTIFNIHLLLNYILECNRYICLNFRRFYIIMGMVSICFLCSRMFRSGSQFNICQGCWRCIFRSRRGIVNNIRFLAKRNLFCTQYISHPPCTFYIQFHMIDRFVP